jgi:cytidylate kinase
LILFIALLARAGHGKSTVAKHLTQKYGAQTISLAGPLKRAAKKVMNFSDAQLWGTQAEKEAVDPRYGFSCRTFLQKLGTEGLREEFGENIHLETMIAQARKGKGRAIYFVDDARFVNEVWYLNRLGRDFGDYTMRGATIKIVCTDAPEMIGGGSAHSSEQEIDRVPEKEIAATVVSSRALGVGHLIEQVELAIATAPRLRILHTCGSDFGV